MEVLNLVQIAIDITFTRESYSDELKKLRTTLEVFQHTFKQIDETNLPPQFLIEAKEEMKKTYEWLNTIPSSASLIDTVKFQIPHNNRVDQIKEKCNSIQQLLSLLTALVVTIKVNPQNIIDIKQLFPKQQDQQPQPTITQCDDSIITTFEPKQFVVFTICADEKTKQIFRRNGVSLSNQYPLKFSEGESDTVVYNISRNNFNLLLQDIPQINTISTQHAQVICRRTMVITPQIQQLPQQQRDNSEVLSQEQEYDIFNFRIFYTINEVPEGQQISDLDKKYNYEFYLKINGRIGMFLYRKKGNIQQPSTILPDTWENRFVNTTIKLEQQDKLAIIMNKPDYKIPIFSFSFSYEV